MTVTLTKGPKGHQVLALIPWLLVACSAAPVTPTTPAPVATNAEPTSQWEFRSLSDMDPVRDIASTSEHLWVATPGGLLRYPIAGGSPLRVTGSAGAGGQRFVAVGEDSNDRLWALSEGGVARFNEGAWSRPTGPVPDVGAISSMVVAPDGTVWVGGAGGLVHHNGEGWARWTNEAEVTSLSLSPEPGGGLWVGTSSNGIWHVAPDGTVSQHVSDRGMPCNAVRTLVANDGGEVWAICQRGSGSILARFDGTRWTALTAPLAEHPIDLARRQNRMILLTNSHLWRIADREPESALAAGEVSLSAVFRGEPARPRRHAARPSPAADDPAERETGVRPPTAAFVPVIQLPAPAGEVRPLPYLRPVDIRVPPDATTLTCDDRGIWIGTNGLGITRVMGRGEERVYRTLDLLVSERPFTVAADGEGRAWFLTRDLRAGELSGAGEHFDPVRVEQDPTAGIQILSFGSRGIDAYALGRFRGRNMLRIYQFVSGNWAELLTRELDLGEANAEFTFFEVDPLGRFWIGLLVQQGDASEPAPQGVVMVDLEVEEVTYHGQEPRGPGAVELSNDIRVVDFTTSNDVWLGGFSGATLLHPDGTVERFSEANGMLGDMVNDLAVDDNDIPWVATPEGVGRYQDGSWRFFLDDWPEGMHVASLAIDSQGELWTGGNRGAVHYDGESWETITARDGLVADRVLSVHVDGRDRVWFVTEAGISLLLRE